MMKKVWRCASERRSRLSLKHFVSGYFLTLHKFSMQGITMKFYSCTYLLRLLCTHQIWCDNIMYTTGRVSRGQQTYVTQGAMEARASTGSKCVTQMLRILDRPVTAITFRKNIYFWCHKTLCCQKSIRVKRGNMLSLMNVINGNFF